MNICAMKGIHGGVERGAGMLFRITEFVVHEIEADTADDALELFNENPYDYEVGRGLDSIEEA